MKQADELIRGEMSAIQSIDAILPKLKDQNEVQQLTTIRRDHEKAVELLRRFSSSQETSKAESAGPWGAFASAFTSGASLFGDKAALNALMVGEQHGMNEYKEALQDNATNPELRMVIERELMPQQERHLSMIRSYVQ